MIFLKQKNCCRVDLRVYMHTHPAGLTDGLEKKKKKKKIRNWNAIVWQWPKLGRTRTWNIPAWIYFALYGFVIPISYCDRILKNKKGDQRRVWKNSPRARWRDFLCSKVNNKPIRWLFESRILLFFSQLLPKRRKCFMSGELDKEMNERNKIKHSRMCAAELL